MPTSDAPSSTIKSAATVHAGESRKRCVGPMTREQRLHLAHKFRIARGSALEQSFARRLLDLEGRVEERVDLLPALSVHVCE